MPPINKQYTQPFVLSRLQIKHCACANLLLINFCVQEQTDLHQNNTSFSLNAALNRKRSRPSLLLLEVCTLT